ncbi:MAG: VIT domain-containing protein [Planctomycetota bacterium]|nr:VIT domain-containing protein [Planctomycetota bacterium]
MKKIVLCAIVVLTLGLAMVLAFSGCGQVEHYNAMKLEKDPLASQLQTLQGSYPAFSTPSTSPGANARSGIELPAGTALSRDEELWVIERASQPQVAQRSEDVPESGALMAKVPGEDKPVPVPLKHTDVKAAIAGYIATVDVTQKYENPFGVKIEAVYVFPLPHNAAVNEFVMTIGDRRIRGIIREREEAEKIYREAKAQGYVASLLTQERPNIFTQSVANIEPGKRIDINIRYYHTLAYVDGWYEWVFPMVVGPRFNPPGSTDGVGAVARGAQGISKQKTEVQYLKPTERNGHDIAVNVEIDAGVSIESVICRSHDVRLEKIEGARAKVVLADGDRIPNKDFVLKYQVAGRVAKSAVMTHRDQKGGYFTLMLVPPKELTELKRKPLEMVFTMDVSGSMNGRPIEQAKAAMRWALSNMDERDTFQVITFANDAHKLFSGPKPVTRGSVNEALSFVDRQNGGGGTMMMEGIRQSLDFPHDENRLRFVSFMTDGYIGNEREILGGIHKWLGPSRIFSFGVGSGPNRYLLDHMAKMGSGAVAFLPLTENPDDVMRMFFDRISHPAMTDIAIDWGGMDVKEVYPQRVPDLFVGRPVILTGRFDGNADATIRVRGVVGGQVRETLVRPANTDATAANGALPAIWARNKIADLADRSTWDQDGDWTGRIKQIALEYGLMSPYTAFVAVDSLTRTSGDHGVTVPVAVPVPDGVKYDTTVQEK